MPYGLDDKLVLAVSTRALFDLRDAYGTFTRGGVGAYRRHQRESEGRPSAPGTAFRLVSSLLRLNERIGHRVVEVIVVSRNDLDSAVPTVDSIDHHGLDIARWMLTDGGDPIPFLTEFGCDLFLSADGGDVISAAKQNLPAAQVLPPPHTPGPMSPEMVTVAFDGDAVVFDAESVQIFEEHGLEAYEEHERGQADVPLNPGPLYPLLTGLNRLREMLPENEHAITTALVSARCAPAHRRVITTLRAWSIDIDRTFLLGGLSKAGVVRRLAPQMFFDDQLEHVESVANTVPAGHVRSTHAATSGRAAGTS